VSELRTVKKIITGKSAIDGAGVKLVRVFGNNDAYDFDPFLLLDAFDSVNPDDYIKGFPWHPHRGIETVTYLISGNVEHGDSLGHNGRITDGDCQWMTAGSGIIHQEMPQPSGRMLGVQLWLNLPSKDKMAPPKYGDILKQNIPIVDNDEHKIHVISGAYNGVAGAVEGDYVKPLFFDVEVNAGCEWSIDTEKELNLFIYIVQGEGCFEPHNGACISEKHAVLFNEGKSFWVKASKEGIRFLLLAGKPLKEPIVWGGPIVMNTEEELYQAFKELDEGMFIK
jgi:redox-sensitive bicupin YhaK (pirin superfamily)